MIEVEIKLPIVNKNELEKDLQKLGFEKGTLVKESDIYFNSSVYDLKKQDMALRIRDCTNIDTGISVSTVTYKGPKLDDVSMTRKELEIEISDGDVCQKIFQGIGFQPLYPVHKLRQYYHMDTMTACIDWVENLGDFLELEIIVDDEIERQSALQKLENILNAIGHDRSETTRRSYLSMLQAKESQQQH